LPAGSAWLVAVPVAVEEVIAAVLAVGLVLEAAGELGVEDDGLELDGVDVGDELVELLLWLEL
jgi:hypothetical protein